MSVELPISRSCKDLHCEAIDSVNRWRGHCTELFARIDAAATAMLEALAGTGAQVKTPHLFGQRMAALRDALASHEQVAGQSRSILKKLDALDPYLKQRNILIHSTGSVWFNANGEWLWRYSLSSSGKTRATENGSFERGEAVAMEKKLASLGSSFCAQLRNLAVSAKA